MQGDIEFSSVKGVVREIWTEQGGRVSSAIVGPSTRIAFRSASANFHVLIQLSAGTYKAAICYHHSIDFLQLILEMWDFDWNGELYFERALQFLKDLFKTWRDEKTQHQLTVVLFSRTTHASSGSLS